MACTPLETELMQRALQNIEQMLTELQATATQRQCLPQDEFAALPFQRSDYREQPAPSAVYFCLTSASALLDVSRSLLDQLEGFPGEAHWLDWAKLSAASKAAGQSAFMASVMLAAPSNLRAAPVQHEDRIPTRACAVPAGPPQDATADARPQPTIRHLVQAMTAWLGVSGKSLATRSAARRPIARSMRLTP
jgi:hypothetical protein